MSTRRRSPTRTHAPRKPRPPGTVGELVDFLAAGIPNEPHLLAWPPNAFAIAGCLLAKSGAYVHVLTRWPPRSSPRPPGAERWATWISRIGRDWRATAVDGPPPLEVQKWWRIVDKSFGLQVSRISEEFVLCDALIQIVAAADEASARVGIPAVTASKDAFASRADMLLTLNSTLSDCIPTSKLRVFPKQHTPRCGLTLRSLTHHLSLHTSGDVSASWRAAPQTVKGGMNLLLAPWPDRVVPDQFRACGGSLHEMPNEFGFVSYSPTDNPGRLSKRMDAMLKAAKEFVGRIDGVILPELALSLGEYVAVRKAVLGHGAFLVGGVVTPPNVDGRPGRNWLAFDMRFGGKDFNLLEQDKHHRWRLDRSQIEQYGLGGHLDPSRDWWEHVEVPQREVHFVPLNDEVTLCCLICEDLARQDPVADLVRSVGPNLVIALLMDAPQVRARWPARYATVLADDPGSSVLTLSSVGMVDLARPPAGVQASRSIALWKDARSASAVEIELPRGGDAVIVSLCNERVQEWTADGRSFERKSAYPRLAGVHTLTLPTS